MSSVFVEKLEFSRSRFEEVSFPSLFKNPVRCRSR